jgi:elongation factor Ts
MTQVTAEMIKELRERTGVGMGKCKEALTESKGDMELAIANLRKAGMASAVKKQGRDTKEGMIGFAETPDCIALVEVNAETDFVIKNNRFQQFLADMAKEIAATKPASLESFLKQHYSKERDLTIDEYRGTIVQAIGENIVIRRLKVIPKRSGQTVTVYSHLGGKILTLVELSGSADEQEMGRGIAMHIAAASPEFLAPEQIPAEVLAHERDIAKSQVVGKPQNIMDKIVEGKLNAFYDSACLLRQKYIRDDTVTVAELVSRRAKETNKPLKVLSFLRWMVGES